jgi:hypothetical protein
MQGKEQDSVETERESVRDRALLEVRDSVVNKIDCKRKHLWQMCEINWRGDQDAANDVVPSISIFSLLIN